MPIKAIATGIIGVGLVFLTTSEGTLAQTGAAAKKEIQRGEYLVGYAGCNDCHSPKLDTPNGPVPDKSRLLSGFPANTQLPPLPADAVGPGANQWGAITNSDLTAWAGPWGVSFAANLTPDQQTGIGSWTAESFIKTIRICKHLGVGRPVLPPMPCADIAVLTDQDLKAVFAYLKSLKPIRNQVPVPIPPK